VISALEVCSVKVFYLWDMVSCHWVTGAYCFWDIVVVLSLGVECPVKNWTLADDATMLGTHQVTQHHIPEEQRP